MKTKSKNNLFSLIKHIVETKESYLKDGKLTRKMDVYEKTVIDSMKIIDENINYQSHNEYISKAEYNLKQVNDLLETEITKSSTYKPVIQELAKEYSIEEPQINFWVRNILHRFIYQLKEPTDDEIADAINLLIIEIEKPPKFWQATIWYKGAFLQNSTPIKLTDEITLRQIQKEDMEKEERLGFQGFMPPPNYAALVVEINKEFENDQGMQNYIEIITNSLKVFRLGTVHHVRYRLDTKSLFGSGQISYPNSLVSSSYKYKITNEDKQKLTKIIEIITSKNEKAKIFDAQPDATNPLGIALKRYNSALFKSDTDEEKVSNFVSCLEALCSTDKAELSHKLSQRVSLLLSYYGFTPKNIFTEIKKAYDIRSIYSHGAFVDPEKFKDLNALTNKLANYTRICFLIFVQLVGVMDKKNIINQLDDSMLDKEILDNFMQTLKTNCEKFE